MFQLDVESHRLNWTMMMRSISITVNLLVNIIMSTFGDQVFQFGSVPVAPASIVGLNGGNWYFVDPESGSDGHDGKTPARAVRTLNQAYQLATDGNNDVIVLLSNGTSTANVTTYLTSALTWSKNKTHLIGAAAPTGISPRARVSTDSTVSTALNPMVTLSGDGCVWSNVQIYAGIDAAVAANGLEVTGERNHFWRMHIAGIGNDKNDVANAYSLKLTGGGENLFEECTIGLDTTSKGDAANSELVFASATARNTFKGCTFRTFASAAGHQFVLAGASAIERAQVFDDCLFLNPSEETSAVEMTEVFSVNSTQNGSIVLTGKTAAHGAADWEGTPATVYGPDDETDPGILNIVA